MARPQLPRPSRAARRAAQRDQRTAPATQVPPAAPASSQWLPFAAWAAVTGLLGFSGLAALRLKVSWYLAVDQLGYLLFARDLLAGRIFHTWAPAQALATRLPDPTDVLAQSYLWDHGTLYSRYAPGFPIILALWTGLFGESAAHALNPLVFLAVLGVVMVLVWQVYRSLWRGTIVVTLAFLYPTGLTLWALTPTRDLSAHFCGLLGLAVLAGRGPLGWLPALGAGLALGYAASIRPDAVLYLIPAAVLAVSRWRAHRRPGSFARLASAGALGVAVGLAPSLLYYGAATGNPFRPTQAVEVEDFFGPARLEGLLDAPTDAKIGFPPRAWRGGDLEPVSGEGMKLAYLSTTLPGNWAKIRKLYGNVPIALAAVGLAATAVLRPAFALALASYLVTALLFYSCWGRPYGRYLVSIWLLTPILIVDGMLGSVELVRYLWRRDGTDLARRGAVAGALFLAVFYIAAGPHADGTVRLDLTRLLVIGTVAALGAAAASPALRVVPIAAPIFAVVLVVFGSARLAEPSPRATVQRPEVTRAAAVAQRTFAPRAVLITTEDVGRPAENYEYYAGVPSFYLTDLQRWRIPIEEAVFLLMVSELEPYLLIPKTLPERDQILLTLRASFALELVADVPPDRNYDYFVASAFHGGMPLELWHVR
jgi:hypothetical protein